MPSVEDFVAAAEWVKARGWNIKAGEFFNMESRCMCPLTALAWLQSHDEDENIVKEWSASPEIVKTLIRLAGFTRYEYGSHFWNAIDITAGLGLSERGYITDESGILGIAVYEALTKRGLL